MASSCPQPPYARLNQPPRSPNGRHRSAPKKNHSDPLDGAGAGAGGAKAGIDPGAGDKTSLFAISWSPAAGGISPCVRTQLPTTTWRTINQPVMPLDPGVSAIDLAKQAVNILPGRVTPWNSSNLTYLQWAQQMQQAINKAMYMPGLSQSQASTLIYGADLSSPPIPYTGIHSGELTGHRAWLVTDTYELCSLAHYFVWEPGKTVEGDVEKVVWTSPSGRTPDRYGGVYAYSSFDLLKNDELWHAMMCRSDFPRREEINPRKFKSIRQSVFIYEVDSLETTEYVTYLGLAYGTVKLWGETVEHEKGYRASFAKLTSIDGFIGVGGFDLAKLRGKYLFSVGE